MSFEVKIKDVKGASAGAQDKSIITLVDNEGLIPIYYTGLAGEWDVITESTYDGPLPVTSTIVVAEEGEEGYGKSLQIYNFPYGGAVVKDASFSVDGVEQAIYVSVPSMQSVDTMSHPSYGAGDVVLYPLKDGYLTSAPYQFIFKFNFDLKSGEYVIDPEWNFGVLVSFTAGMMIYDEFTAITFTR